MENAVFLEIASETLFLLIILSLPVLFASFLADIITSILAMWTKTSEPVAKFCSKVIAVLLCLLPLSSWIAIRMGTFANKTFELAASINI